MLQCRVYVASFVGGWDAVWRRFRYVIALTCTRPDVQEMEGDSIPRLEKLIKVSLARPRASYRLQVFWLGQATLGSNEIEFPATGLIKRFT